MSTRVEITGQFNVDNPCRSPQEAKVDRQAGAYFTNNVPQNWTTFCDKVDGVLKKYDAIGGELKTNFMFLYVLFFFVVVFSLFPSIIGRGYGYLKYYAPVVYVMIVPFIINFCRARKKMRKVVEEITSICQSESGNGVQYQFGDEHWGGLSKPHVRRYFITVTIDEEQPQHQEVQVPVVHAANVETYEIETNSETFPGSSSNPYSIKDTTPSNSTGISSSGAKPSLFDQMNGDLT